MGARNNPVGILLRVSVGGLEPFSVARLRTRHCVGLCTGI